MGASSSSRSPEREALLPHDGPDNGEYGTANGSVEPGAPRDEPLSTVSPEILEARKRLKYIFAGLALPFFLSSFDRYIVNTTYARIAAEFNALEFASWISTSYFLAVACTQPLWGKLSDVFGRKTCLMIAYPLFATGGLLIALSKSFGMLIAGRAIQGLGAGGTGILTTIILNDLVETRERGNWQAYVNLVGSVGSSLGAPLGGIFADQIGWRWAFFLQVPLVIVSLINVYVLLHLPQKKDKTGIWQNLRRLDILGATLLTCTIFCLLFGIDRGSQISFSKPISFVPLAACPVLLVLLALNEEKLAVERFLPPLRFMNRSVWADYLVNLLAFGALTSVQFWVPFFYQAYDATTPTQTGVYLLPATIGGISGNLLGGRLMKKTGYYRTQIVVGFFVAAVGVSIIVLGTVIHDHDVVVISIGSACASFFFGMGLAGTLLALICNIDRTHQGIFTACMFTLRSLGSASALSLSGTAIQSYFRAVTPARLPEDVDAGDIVRRVGHSLDAIGDLEPRLQQVVRECYAEAVRVGFIVPMACYALAGAVALLIKNRKIPAG